MKICITCKEEKCLNEFPNRVDSKDGKRNDCRVCKRKKDTSRYHSNPDAAKEVTARLSLWRESWTDEKREQNRERCRKYAKENKHKGLANVRRRQARLKQAHPAWAEDEFEKFCIDEIYHLSRLRTEMLEIKFNVDHVVPLTSKFVCGLHCVSNLSIEEESKNKAKNNRWWPDMWDREENYAY